MPVIYVNNFYTFANLYWNIRCLRNIIKRNSAEFAEARITKFGEQDSLWHRQAIRKGFREIHSLRV